MNAQGRGREYVNGNEMPIILETSPSRPEYRKTSGMLLTALREFYRKQENDETYQEWKARKEGKAG